MGWWCRDRFERALGESAVAIIVVEVLLHAIVGHKDVCVSVGVVVRKRGTERPPLLCGDAGRLADILEGSIAPVAIENAGRWRKLGWWTVGMPIPATNFVMVGIPFHVSSDEEIEMAVIIEIEKARGDRPAAGRYSSFLGHIRESAVAIVVVQDILAVAGDVEIGETVIVIVAHGDAHAVVAVAGGGKARGLSNVRETAIAILAVQAVPVTRIATVKLFRYFQRIGDLAAIYKEYVEETIVVIVEQRRAARHSFNEEFARRRRISKKKIDPAQRLHFENRACGNRGCKVQKITPRKPTSHVCGRLLTRRDTNKEVRMRKNRLTRN